MDLSFYQHKKILVTGHTGFKGSWLCRLLIDQGAQVVGYALASPDSPSLFDLSGIEQDMVSVLGDIRDLKHLQDVFKTYQPEIVFHLAAQPLVRLSYDEPVETYATNVMGTVNVLECVRKCPSVKSFVNVTTDKVYFNTEEKRAYQETDRLDGFDPYSNSKSCSELVTGSYKNSFFQDRLIAISTARSGNVIGGGDFAKDRIIPDCFRAAAQKQNIVIRNPHSTRPYQHVLETLRGYLMIAQAQYEDLRKAGSYNIGPDDHDNLETLKMVELFCSTWGQDLSYTIQTVKSVHEAQLLQLDHAKITQTLGWMPVWTAQEAIQTSVQWYQAFLNKKDMKEVMIQQIQEYFKQC